MRNAPRNADDEDARGLAPTFLDRPAEVRLDRDGTTITWTPAAKRRVLLPENLLEQFVGLADQPHTADAIRSFADRFGPLQLCADHLLPYSHSPHPFPKPKAAAETIYACSPSHHEPVSRWLEFIDQTRSAMAVATDLNAPDTTPAGTLWSRTFSGPIGVSPLARSEANDRASFAKLLRAFLFVGDVRPRIVWEGNEVTPAFELGGGLFGALALQLMQWTAANRGIYVCRGCLRWYEPRRRLREGESTYCDRTECQRKRKAKNARERRAS